MSALVLAHGYLIVYVGSGISFGDSTCTDQASLVHRLPSVPSVLSLPLFSRLLSSPPAVSLCCDGVMGSCMSATVHTFSPYCSLLLCALCALQCLFWEERWALG